MVETRLFSEGLHTLGQPPSPEHMRQYLEAYFGDDMSSEAVDLVSASNGESLDAVKTKLQRIYSQVGHTNPKLQRIYSQICYATTPGWVFHSLTQQTRGECVQGKGEQQRPLKVVSWV